MNKTLLLSFIIVSSAMGMETAHELDQLLSDQYTGDPNQKYPHFHQPEPDPMTQTFEMENGSEPLTEKQSNLIQQKDERLAQLIKWQSDPLFKTKVLQSETIMQELIDSDGFERCPITGDDGAHLDGLFKARKNARCSVLVVPGFWPGNLQGMLSLYKLLPDDCNILFMGPRGQDPNSDGNRWTDIFWHKNPSRMKPQDILCALSLLHNTYPDLPNIVYGECSGGADALNTIKTAGTSGTKELKLVGTFVDSSWTKLVNTGHTIAWNRMVKPMNSIVNMIQYPLAKLAYLTWLRGAVKKVDAEQDLSQHIQEYPFNAVRTVFIHGQNDDDARIGDIQELQANLPNSILYTSQVVRPHAEVFRKDKARTALWLRQEIEQMLTTGSETPKSDNGWSQVGDKVE